MGPMMERTVFGAARLTSKVDRFCFGRLEAQALRELLLSEIRVSAKIAGVLEFGLRVIFWAARLAS